MSAPEIGACAFEALSIAEEVNIKSKNLKGGLKGQLRDSLKELKEIITALMLKINAKGVIELLRAENVKETARNMDLNEEITKLKKEVAVLNARLLNRDEKEMDYRCKNCESNLSEDGLLGSPTITGTSKSNRKRRRIYTPSPPSPPRGGGKDGGNVEDGIEDLLTGNEGRTTKMERYKKEARISHLRTKKAVRDARQTLAESDEMEEMNETANKREDNAGKNKTLEDIYSMIGKYLTNKQPEVQGKPTILSVEEVNPTFVFKARNRNEATEGPSTSWADIAARIPWKSKIAENYGAKQGPETQEN